MKTKHDRSSASAADVSLPETPTQDDNSRARTAHIRGVMGDVFESYHKTLKVDIEGMGYFADQDISDETTLPARMIGLAPLDQSSLINAHKPEDLLATGLFFTDEDGEITPIYTNRLVIPFYEGSHPVFSIGERCGKRFVGQFGEGDPNEELYVLQHTHADTPDVDATAVKRCIWGGDRVQKGGRVLVVNDIVEAIYLQQELEDEVIVSVGTTWWMESRWGVGEIAQLAADTQVAEQVILVTTARPDNHDEKEACKTGRLIEEALEALHEASSEMHVESVVEAQTADTKGASEKPQPYFPKVRVLRLRRSPEVKTEEGVSMRDYLNAGKKSELLDWIQRSQTVRYNNQRTHVIDKPHRFFNKQTFQPQVALNEVYLENNYFMNSGELLYVYRDGVYQPIARHFIDGKVGRMLGNKANAYYINVVGDLAEKQNRVDEADVNDNPNEINLQNGWFNLVTGEVTPHTPDRWSTVQLPVDSTKGTTEAKDELLAFINKVIPADAITLVQMMCGYCLHYDASYQRAFLLYGKGRNGKGTLLKMIQAMLGEDNHSTESLEKLSDTRWGTANLFGMMANIVDDISETTIRDSSDFKMLAAGETISAERKNKDPFKFKNKAKLIFSANAIPKSIDKTRGFYRRWVFIDMDGKVIPRKEVIRDYYKKLTTPEGLSVFFHWAVEGLQALLALNQFPTSQSSDNLLGNYKKENDPVLTFVKEHLTYKANAKHLKVANLRDAYKKWCEEWERKPTPNKLKEAIEAEFGGQGVKQQREWVNSKQERFWFNLHYDPLGIPDTDGIEVDEDDDEGELSTIEFE